MITVPNPHGRDRQCNMGEAVLRRAYANARRIGQVTVLSNLYERERGKTAWLALYGRIYLELSQRGQGKIVVSHISQVWAVLLIAAFSRALAT